MVDDYLAAEKINELATNNNIGKNAYNEEDVAIELGAILLKQYPELLKTRYEVKELTFDSIELLDFIAKKKNFPLRNHLPDLEKAAIVLLNDYRHGLLGRISLETPQSRMDLESYSSSLISK